MNEPLKTNDKVNRDAASELSLAKSGRCGGSGSTDCSIRVWKIGSLKSPASPELLDKLRNILATNTSGDTLELIWGPELNLQFEQSENHATP